MIDKENVRELCERFMDVAADDEDEVITEWLEQNQPSPQVVGLSDEQVEDLASDLDSWNIGDTDGFIFHIKEWLKAQTFVQPESKEVVVGLTDEQVKDFSRLYGLTTTQQNRLNANLTDFLTTQTFAQPRAFDDSELSEKYMNLYDDYQSLLIDNAQLLKLHGEATSLLAEQEIKFSELICENQFEPSQDYISDLIMFVASRRKNNTMDIVEVGELIDLWFTTSHAFC